MKKQLRPVLIFIFLSTLGFGGLILGALTSKSVTAYAADRYAELQIFTKVLNLVQRYYVEDVDVSRLLAGGIKGMLNELDPHTNYLPPDIYKEFETETSGEFGGLGIEITVKKGILTIISPIEDTPAWKAGLKAGDRVIGINGKSTKGLSLVEAAQHMRGKLGDIVTLQVVREGEENPLDFKVKRGVVKLKSVKYTNLEQGYAYLRITSFIESTYRDLKKMIKRHRKKNKELKGMIIDLRRNPGGLLDQAVKISDMFLKEGVIVSTVGRSQKEKDTIYATQSETLEPFPLIVLVNEFSASASEILAGALQDNKRALIMGQRSFGKGSVQSVIKLGDGSGLKLTVARYYTPSGRSIQAEGIQPDVSIDNIDTEALEKAVVQGKVRREKDISGHLKSGNKKTISQKEDSFLYWRLNARKKKEKDLTGKERLLSRDYQALQAYNYLKAWKVMQNFGAGNGAKSDPTKIQ